MQVGGRTPIARMNEGTFYLYGTSRLVRIGRKVFSSSTKVWTEWVDGRGHYMREAFDTAYIAQAVALTDEEKREFEIKLETAKVLGDL